MKQRQAACDFCGKILLFLEFLFLFVQAKRKEDNQKCEDLGGKDTGFERLILNVTNNVLKYVQCLTSTKINAECLQAANVVAFLPTQKKFGAFAIKFSTFNEVYR